MDETLRKALEALKAAKRSMAMVIDETGGPHWGRKLMNASLSCAESERKVNAAIAAIEQHKTVVRMLTDEEAIDCECDKFDNTVKFIQRKFAEKNGLTIGEHG